MEFIGRNSIFTQSEVLIFDVNVINAESACAMLEFEVVVAILVLRGRKKEGGGNIDSSFLFYVSIGNGIYVWNRIVCVNIF